MMERGDAAADSSVLTYLNTRIALTAARVGIEKDLRFFDSHFTRHAATDGATMSIILLRRTPPRPPADAELVFLRKSRTEFFTVRARRVASPGDVQLYCESSGTRITFALAEGSVHMDVPAERPGRELIELVRNIVLKNEENQGVVMVHAAVVELDGRAVVIVGPKGAGKTSSALELILNHGGRMLSGDKALLVPDSDPVQVAGWPDWPHLGLGTITRFPQLKERFKLDGELAAAEAAGDIWSMRHKLPLDPVAFRAVVPFSRPASILPVAAFLYPSLGLTQEASLDRLLAHADRLAANVESAFGSGTDGWNPLVDPSPYLPRYVGDALERARWAPAFELTGTGEMPPSFVSRLLAG